jgi:hypothetical protein
MSAERPGQQIDGMGGDIGADGAGGRAGDVGGSTSGGRASDVQTSGAGQEVRTGRTPFGAEEAAEADIPREGTPDDLKLGGRAKPGLDPEQGASEEDGPLRSP